MKRTIFPLAIATMFMAGTLFTGCQSSDVKVKAAQDEVDDAKKDLKEVQKDANAEAQKVAYAEEWNIFKSESEVEIRENEIRIAELRKKMKSSGKTIDAIRVNKIDELEQKNRNLKTRIDAYEKSQSDWESFKREFSHDMAELGQAFNDLTVDNKK